MSTPYIHVDFVCLNDYSNQRARELSTSAARSHASKVTHLKKKKPASRRVRGFADQEDEQRAQIDLYARFQAAQEGQPISSSSLTSIPYAVNYYLDNVAPNMASPFHVFGVKVFWNDNWLRCVSQEPYYSAFSASQQLNRDTCDQPDLTTPSTRLLEHKLRAIRSLRQQLAGGVHIDNTTLHAMLKLAFVEARLGQGSMYDMHRDAVGKFIQGQRRSEHSDDSLAFMVSAHDLYRRMQSSFPALPAPEPSGPAAQGDLLTEIAAPLIDSLPQGFQRLAMNHKIPLELLRVLCRTSELLLNRSQQPSTSHDSSLNNARAGRSRSCHHYDFWTACPSLIARSTSSEEEPEIGNLSSLGLWLYVAMEFSSHPIYETLQHWISIARWIRRDLTNKLRLCVGIRPDDEESCLKWLINIAIQSWRDPKGELLPDGFSLNAFRTRRFPWLDAIDEGFFPFTKGSSLDSPFVRSRVHKGLRTHSRIHVRSSRKSQSHQNQPTPSDPG